MKSVIVVLVLMVVTVDFVLLKPHVITEEIELQGCENNYKSMHNDPLTLGDYYCMFRIYGLSRQEAFNFAKDLFKESDKNKDGYITRDEINQTQ